MATRHLKLRILVDDFPDEETGKFYASCDRYPSVVVESSTHDECLALAAEIFKSLLAEELGSSSLRVGALTRVNPDPRARN